MNQSMNQDGVMPLKQSRMPDMSMGLPGVHLRQARESRRLTQHDVALQLRLSSQVIDAIENDDYKKLPGQIFVRGYLRAYARLVHLPEEDIIQAFNHLEVGQQKTEPLVPSYTSAYAYDGTPTTNQSSGKLLRWLIFLVVLLLIIMLVQWWVSENPSINLKAPLNSLLTSVRPAAVPGGAA
jgi:cytoskeletal protein RodZ